MSESGQDVPEVPVEAQSEVASDVIEFYADAMNIRTLLYTGIIELGEIRPGKPQLMKVRVKVSPQMLKAISLLTGKHVRDYEEIVGQKIKLPNDVLHSWGLEEEIQ